MPFPLKSKAMLGGFTAVALALSACSSADDKKSTNLTTTQAATETSPTTLTQSTSTPQTVEEAATQSAACELSHSEAGRIQVSEIDEISGLLYSKNHEVLWAHNDDSKDNRLFALSSTGERVATVEITDTKLDDWEDSAIVPGDESSPDLLYLGSIGDNGFNRKKVTVFRVEEPELSDTQTQKPDRIDLTYPDRPRDAEAMFVDPLSGDIFILQKAHNDTPAQLFIADAPGEGDQSVTLRPAGEIDFLSLSKQAENDAGAGTKPHLVTGADVSRDGKTIAIRTYGHVWIWSRDVSQPLQKAFERDPCQAASVEEPQGEAIALTPNGDGYVTVSEGAGAAVNLFE